MSPRRYNRRSRLAAAEETRRRIVRATAELHAEHGALGTTHEMIARRAGVSLPTAYKYFPTRNDLIPHCTGLVLSEAPVKLDESAFAGNEGHLPDLGAVDVCYGVVRSCFSIERDAELSCFGHGGLWEFVSYSEFQVASR